MLLLSVVAIMLIQTWLFTQSAATRGFATGDGGVKLWQVLGILHSGQLNAPIDYPGAVYDPTHLYSPFVPPWFLWRDGRPYSEYTSPFIWLSVPLYSWFGHAGLLIMPWLSGALLVILTAWLAWRVRPDRSAALATLIVGLSSPLLVYSMEFWEHTPGAFLAVLAVAAIVKSTASSRSPLWLLVAGAAVGLGLTMRAELYVYPAAIAIGLWLAAPRRMNSDDGAPVKTRFKAFARSIVYLALGGLLIAGPWWLYQTSQWGSPFGPRLQQNVPVLGGSQMLARLRDTTGHNYTMLYPIDGEGRNELAIVVIMALGLAIGLRWLRRTRWPLLNFGFWILAVAVIVVAAITTWRVTQGQRPSDLLTTFPIILLLLLPLLPGAELGHQRSEITRFLSITSLAFVLLVLLVSPFEGGIQWGPRFLLPIVAPLAVVVATHLERLWAAAGRIGRIGLAITFVAVLSAGGYSTWSGTQFMRQGQIASEFMSAVINDSAERVVVANAWFIAQNAPYTFGNKIWLMAESEDALFKLIQVLRKQTQEPGMMYITALTWTHIDPQPLMGPRIALSGEQVYINAPTQYMELSHYLLLK
jgi:4-amino-4-deoxy-L-arabinose transferase-like glycosyltransferase